MSERADVLVVGAGPAGSTAALRLAAAGRDVVLLDRACFPRSKVCGDGLTPRAIDGLDRLGVWPEVARSATFVAQLLTKDLRTGSTSRGPLPSRVEGRTESGAVVSRTVLDDALRRAAVGAGARFEPNAHVRIVEPIRSRGSIRVSTSTPAGPRLFEAAVVIAADGAGSRIAQMAFGESPGVVRGVAVRQYWRVRTPAAFTICIPLSDDRADVPGYGWVFPVGPDAANVGVGVVGEAGRSARALYGRFIALLGRDADAWRDAEPLGPVEGGALAAGMRRERVALGGLLFVGDAAGAANPFSGEGIAQAIEGGVAVADAIASTSTSDRTARLGDAYWERLVGLYPQSTRNVEWLPWLVDRGRTFTREFWHGVSSDARVVSRAARRMSLDEASGARRSFSSTRADRAWRELCRRLRARRPLLVQLLEAIRDDATPYVREAVTGCRAADAAAGGWLDDVDVALTIVALVMLLANDTRSGRATTRTREGDELASWAGDAVALGAADILMAELFAVLARLPPRWASAIAREASTVLARATRRAATGRTKTRLRADLGDLPRAVATRVARPFDVDASRA